MDRKKVKEIAKSYGLAVKKIIPNTEIILFGSYAKNKANRDSDIDIAVAVDNVSLKFLDTHQLLYKLRRKFEARIEPLLISTKRDPNGFMDEIRKTGIIVA